jgi:PEGA domain
MRPRWLGLISLAFCALCSWRPAIAAMDGIPTAVLGLEAIDAPAALVDEVTEQLRQRVSASPDLRRVAGKDLVELKLVFSCADEGHACMAQAGKSLDAEKLIFGSVKKSGRDFAIWLKLFDVRKEKVEAWVTDTLPAGQSDQAGIHVASGRWFAKLTGRPLNAGTIQVSANLYGAVVTVDGIPAGTTGEQPLTLPEVKPGRHEVVATKAGHARASQQFIVPPGQTVVVNLTLPPEGEADATSNSAPPAVAARRALDAQAPESQGHQKEDDERTGSEPSGGDARGAYRTGFWVTLGASLVSAGAAVKFGLDVLKVNKDLDQFRRYPCASNPAESCDTSGRPAPLSDTDKSLRNSKISEGDHDRNLQWVFIGVGSALGITSAYLLYKGYLDSDEAAVHHEAHRGLRIFPTAGVSSGGVLAEFDF